MPHSSSPDTPGVTAAGLDPLLKAGELSQSRRQLAAAGKPPRTQQAARQGPEKQQPVAVPGEKQPALRSALLDSFGIRHGFSTRHGGVSTVYSNGADLNLGFTASDPRDHVLTNRDRLLQHVFGAPRPLVTLRQRHTTLLHPAGLAEAGEEAALTGDALWTRESGVVLGVQTADCVPILLSDRANRVVAAFHAGWRGTLRRIVETGIGRLRTETGIPPSELVAAIGPSIRACCYAVGEEVESEFRSQFAYAEELFADVYDTDPVRKKYPMLFLTQRAPGHSDLGPSRHLDLAEANRRQLVDAGLPETAVDVLPHCTSCRTDLFFSHRAQAGFTGRMLSVIAVRDEPS